MKEYTFKIPVSWSVATDMIVQATSLEEAINKADKIPLPDDAEYIDGSFDIDQDSAEIINEELVEVIKIDQADPKDLPLLLNTMQTNRGKVYLFKKLKEA